jgi:predicted DNA-binding transcriptional regulator AlpA
MGNKLLHFPPASQTDTTSLLTMEELVLYFKGQYSDKTFYRWRKYEGMPSVKIGRRYWFCPTQIMKWIERKYN